MQPCNNTLRPRLNRRPFADDILKCIFLNENEWISPRISLKFVPKVRINNIPALVQIMAWRRSGGKPLSEPMMVSLLTHICVTRPQRVNIGLTDYNIETNAWCPIRVKVNTCPNCQDMWHHISSIIQTPVSSRNYGTCTIILYDIYAS